MRALSAGRRDGFRGWTTLLLALAACTTPRPQGPVHSPATATAAAVPHPAWRPLHQGHADLSTGVYIREDDDLVVDTPFPIVLRRTYNSGDGHARQFGVDATHPGEWWIYGNGDPRVPWGDLILADGGRIHFTRISPGFTRNGAILRHDATPTEFNGALLSWTGSLWQMRLRDGSTASFADCSGGARPCSVIERRDPDGHTITFARDSAGLLLRMESEGRSIRLDYDDRKRIIRAYDTSGHDVAYTYDEGDRLIRTKTSDGIVRQYAYESRNALVRIVEPGRIVENWFDESGRWTHQVVKDSENDPTPYIATAHYVIENGAVVESDFDEGGGLEVCRYNAQHYIVSEALFADSATPVTFRYDLSPTSNEPSGAMMSCTGATGPVTRHVPLTVHDDEAKARAMQASCVLHR